MCDSLLNQGFHRFSALTPPTEMAPHVIIPPTSFVISMVLLICTSFLPLLTSSIHGKSSTKIWNFLSAVSLKLTMSSWKLSVSLRKTWKCVLLLLLPLLVGVGWRKAILGTAIGTKTGPIRKTKDRIIALFGTRKAMSLHNVTWAKVLKKMSRKQQVPTWYNRWVVTRSRTGKFWAGNLENSRIKQVVFRIL